MQGERDFPMGHPAASDYKGEAYTPPRAPWEHDYAADNPARAGANTSPLDSPDGMREAIKQRIQDLDELRAIGALPAEHSENFDSSAPTDVQTKEAHEYLKSRGYTDSAADDILSRYGIDAVLADKQSAKKQQES